MDSLILGKGFSSPITLNKKGGFTLSSGEDKVKQSILTILATKKGERVLRPDFGCGIHDFVFEPNNYSEKSRIEFEVKDSLEKFEKRITIDEVVVDFTDSLCKIIISYTVNITGDKDNLVYPFYLEVEQ